MLATIVKKVFGTKNDRELKRISRLVAGVNTHGDAMAELDDGALQAKSVGVLSIELLEGKTPHHQRDPVQAMFRIVPLNELEPKCQNVGGDQGP